MDIELLKYLLFSTLKNLYSYSSYVLFLAILVPVFGIVAFTAECIFNFNKTSKSVKIFDEELAKSKKLIGLKRGNIFKNRVKNKSKISVFKKKSLDAIKENIILNENQNLVKITPTISASYCALFRKGRRSEKFSENKENVPEFDTPKRTSRRNSECSSSYVLRNRRINI